MLDSDLKVIRHWCECRCEVFHTRTAQKSSADIGIQNLSVKIPTWEHLKQQLHDGEPLLTMQLIGTVMPKRL